MDNLPRLYNKYVGHDDNRDFYMSTMPETTNMNRLMYQEWFPQIVYNHHQTGPAGTVVFMPPFRIRSITTSIRWFRWESRWCPAPCTAGWWRKARAAA